MTQICARCESQSIVKDYDYGRHCEYQKCQMCGSEKFKEKEIAITGNPIIDDFSANYKVGIKKGIAVAVPVKEEDPMRSLPDEQIKKVEELTLSGMSNGEINRETGIDIRTVGRYVKAYYERTGQKKPEQRSGNKKGKRVDIKYGEEGVLERETVKTIENLIVSYQVQVNHYQGKIDSLKEVARLLRSEAA
jgi:transposase